MATERATGETARRSQRERSDATTVELVDAARALFAEQGFAAAKLDDIAARAGVTKGALYHHFEGKSSLFRAVYEREQQALIEVSVEATRRRRDPWKGFAEGCRAFLEASMSPDVARITLVDAYVALGWDRMREIEDTGTLAVMIVGIERAIAAGRVRPQPAEPLARLLFGAMCEGAMAAARAPDPKVALRSILKALQQLLDGLTVEP